MANPALTPSSKWKMLLILVILVAGLALAASHFLQAVSDSFNPNREYDSPLIALVTDVEMSRQQYRYYLEGSETGWKGFNQYAAANPANRKAMSDDLGYDPSDLGHYLHKGDSLIKAAYSPILVVRRGTHATRWILYEYTEEAKRGRAAAAR